MGFFFLIVIALITACLPSSIAEDKGHDRTAWAYEDFCLLPLAWLQPLGLSDRKLRKYIKQIGEKQEAIKAEPLPKTSEEERKEKIIGSFELVQTAEEDAIWEKILSLLSSDVADKADRSKSYLNYPLNGTAEFVVTDSNRQILAFASRKESSNNNYQWEVSMNWLRSVLFYGYLA